MKAFIDSATAPRARGGAARPILGTLFLLAGWLTCGLIGTSKLHVWLALRDVSATSAPPEVSWARLLRQGVPDAGVVTLSELEVVDSQRKLASMDAGPLTKMVTDPNLKVFTQWLLRGELRPRGGPPGNPQVGTLRLPMGPQALQTAREQLARRQRLRVAVTEDSTFKSLRSLASFLELDVPPTLARAAERRLWTARLVNPNTAANESLFWFGGSFLAMVLGGALCMTTSLGRWVLVSPLAGIVSLLGTPLRWAVGRRLLSTGCFLGALGLMVLADHVAFDLGRLGQSTGNPWWWAAAAGTLALAAGIGGVLLSRLWGRAFSAMSAPAVPPSHRTGLGKSRRLLGKLGRPRGQASTEADDGRTGHAVARAKAAIPALCHQSYIRRYLDPRLTAVDHRPLRARAGEITESWENLAFDEPLLIEITRGETASSATVQRGCRDVVIAMTDVSETAGATEAGIQLRLISVLRSGEVVVTLSGDAAADRPFRGGVGERHVTQNTSAQAALADHLQAATVAAERRDTGLVTLESGEWRDVVLYAERCLAELRHRGGEEKWDLAPAGYGRFCYPVQPVAVAEAVH